MTDAIRPDHYKLTIYRDEDDPNERPTEIECIDVIEAMALGFHLGSALKYAWRLGRKHDRLAEEIEKMRWYLDRWHEKVWRETTLAGMVFAHFRNLSTLLLQGEREVALSNDHEQLAGNLRGFCMTAGQHIESGKPFDSMPYMRELVVFFELESVLCG